MPEVADLLLVQQKLRLCDSKTRLGYLLVNDTTKITPFDTAVLWLADEKKVEAVSGLPEPVNNTPFTDWIGRICQRFYADHERNPVKVKLDDLPEEDRNRWQEYLAGEVVWLPLTTATETCGGLLLCRKTQ